MVGKNLEHSPLVTVTEPNCSHQTIVQVLTELFDKDILNQNTILLSDLDGCLRFQPKWENSKTFNLGKIHPAEMELLQALHQINGLLFAVVTNQVTHGWLKGGFWGDGRGQQISRIISKLRQRIPNVSQMTAFADFFAQEKIPIFGGGTNYFLPTFLLRYKVTHQAVQEVGDWIAQSADFDKKELLIMIGDWQSDMFFGENLLQYLQKTYQFGGQGLFYLIDGKTKPNYDLMSSLACNLSSLSK